MNGMNLTNIQDIRQAVPTFWQGRLGQPRTEEERKKRHKARYGTTTLPPRGTGRMMALLGQR